MMEEHTRRNGGGEGGNIKGGKGMMGEDMGGGGVREIARGKKGKRGCRTYSYLLP